MAVPKRAIVGASSGLFILGFAAWLVARPTILQIEPPPLVWSECQPEQAEVLILGTFHFAQDEAIDVLRPERQRELADLLDRLEAFAPTKIGVEHPFARTEELGSQYRLYLDHPEESLQSRNETYQIGFRLARRLGHEQVFPVDVRMNLWHDSIAVFDEEHPGARWRLRARWDVRYPANPAREEGASLTEILRTLNGNRFPPNAEMYAGFLPLVEDDIYAGALKLRPWYDRNLRIVQNLFRTLEDEEDRVLLVIGFGHVRILKQILDFTPQICAVDPLRYLSGVVDGDGGSSTPGE